MYSFHTLDKPVNRNITTPYQTEKDNNFDLFTPTSVTDTEQVYSEVCNCPSSDLININLTE